MSDELLKHYEKELAFVQKAMSEFAQRHPKIGNRLRISDDRPEDPFVERLLDGVALLNARIQDKLNDDFPEMTDGVMGVMYPHYQRPIPSMTIVQFQAAEALDECTRVAPKTELDTNRFGGETCRFSTCYPVDIQPFKVESAQLLARPFIAPGADQVGGADGVLKIALKTLSSALNFAELKPGRVRFYLRGQPKHIYPLYEHLLNGAVKVVLAKGEGDTKPVFCDASIIQPVGFDIAEGLLPYPASAFEGYRLLTEYFVFPQKFLFVDIDLSKLPPAVSNELNLYIYLKESDGELEHYINASVFVLGCTPAVNLFSYVADPIALDHAETEYRVVPDGRRTGALEIYSIDQVNASNSTGNKFEYTPFYGIRHRHTERNHGTYWYERRLSVIEGENHNEEASEINISLVDLNFDPNQPSDETLDLRLTCFNRNLPARLPAGTNQPKLNMVEGDAPVASIHCVTPPTQTLRPPLRNRAYWRLMSHLNLNHLSLTGDDDGDALKEILRLYDFRDADSTRKMIESIRRLQVKPIMAPIKVGKGTAMCRGTQVEMEFDPRLVAGGSPYLFASVLERFLALYCSLNSFTRLIARITNSEGEMKRWPPRAGEKALL
ncbi:type VI secretion system baseplate subunit TssF [Ketobacter sp.]|uniref:type VI secretion system baseplate subunit TssF n=1 Tax=Ketobacter sp. TaxID=2083498 RepID=UPI000F2C6E8D|nr:type VI secretion system baseplate subunit TssF [Ketobacter sp.]RLU01775.1 MAG: type VI secretion system baseplate subunit TssF [Ketobacter sp.]